MRKVMYMRDWAKKLDDFLRLNDREVLQGFGRISAQLAKEKAEREFTKYERHRRQIEDKQAADAFAQEGCGSGTQSPCSARWRALIGTFAVDTACLRRV